MIRIKNHKQLDIFDPWGFLSPKRRQMLDNSWAGLFQKEIIPVLPIKAIMPYFASSFGRPTKELYTVLAVQVLQQTFDFTDLETIQQFAYNIQWHYALNISEESDSAKYISPKTLWNMRNLIAENELEALIFDAISDKLSRIFSVKKDHQRIDSVHIKSNMRRLGRIGIFTRSIHKFLVNLKRGHNTHFDSVDKQIVEKYLTEKDLECFSMIKPSDGGKTLNAVSKDLFCLVQQFKGCDEVTAMHSYKLLNRVLHEQCNLTPSDENPLEVKKPKEIPSDSLQNPSDPDATYSGHKGQGYQVQVMETYCKDEESKDNALNLITHVHVEPSHNSDANALVPAIESVEKRGLLPEELLADSLYGSDDNCRKAQQEGVELVAPTMGRSKGSKVKLSDFSVSEKGSILACPQGHAPERRRKKGGRHRVSFNRSHCTNCPCVDDCPVKPGKKFYYLGYTDKEMRISHRKANEQTEYFVDRYRWRAGVEATMSEFDRRTGVKHLRFRGLKAVRFCATLKAAGLNILRATAARVAGIQPDEAGCVA